MVTTSNPLARAACAYAARGWQVFPVHGITEGECTCGSDCGDQGGKHPCTAHGLLDATTDQSQLKKWWNQWPNANIAIRTGQASGIFAVDLDIKNSDGPGNWAELMDINGPVETLTSITGGGGQHWVFTLTEGLLIKNQVNSQALGEGIDVRGEGGYIVVWPSLHLSGEIYEWDHAVSPMPAPHWLIDILPKTNETKQTATVPQNMDEYEPWVSAAMGGVAEEQRNNTASRLVGYFHHKGLPADVIQSLMVPFAEGCTPAMDLKELHRTIQSVTRYERQVVEHHIIDPPAFEEHVEGYRYHWPHHGVTMYLEELGRVRGDMHCELTVEAILPGLQPIIHGPVGFNLTSTTTRNSLVKYLNEQASVNWAPLLDTVSRLAIAQYRIGEPVIDLMTYQASPPNWLLWPFILEDEMSILFGDGGNGKTYLALAAALSLQDQKPYLGFEPHGHGRILYLDWETSPGTHAERLRRITGDRSSFQYIRCTAPLHEMTRQLKRHMVEQRCNVLMVDSIVAACGGEPERADVAIRLCNSIRALNTTSLLLGHNTKTGDRSGKPFGSTFWHNEARSTIEVSRQQESGENTMQLGLYHRKFNDGELGKPQGITAKFEDSRVFFERTDIGASPELREKLTAVEHIISWMNHETTEPVTALEIARGTGISESTVRKALQRDSDKPYPRVLGHVSDNTNAISYELASLGHVRDN